MTAPADTTWPPQEDTLERFARRIIADALAEGTAAYWRRRAKAFDRVGTTRCDQTAQACRNAAHLASWDRGGADAALEQDRP